MTNISSQTPQSNRAHVSLFGETNSGKSALFNAILGQSAAIVSEIPGATTDPVSKSMELLPYGPIVLVDTAGLNDKSLLGAERMKKTKWVLDRTDLAIYAIDPQSFDRTEYERLVFELKKRNTPYFTVITKMDTYNDISLTTLSEEFYNGISVSIHRPETIDALKSEICRVLSENEAKDQQLIGGLLPPGSVALMVIPVDTEAPKGRLILPQVQILRDCLDHGVRCHVTTDAAIEGALKDCRHIDLVVTDSQVFKAVSNIVPPEIPLTSFSILTSRQKGGLEILYQGAAAIADLKDGDRVLIAEACTHNRTHEDVGHVKIPNILKKTTEKSLVFDFVSGRDFPEDLTAYALVIHCGGCMITPKEMSNRLLRAENTRIPMTNYGMALAYCNGILERSMEIFKLSQKG